MTARWDYFSGPDGTPLAKDAGGRIFEGSSGEWRPVATRQPPPPPIGGGHALPFMPQIADLKADAAVNAMVRASQGLPTTPDGMFQQPFYPTQPVQFTGSGKMVRDYSTGLISTDADYVVGTAAPRIITFPSPCTLVDVRGAAFNTAAGNALPVGVGPRDCWLLRMFYATGENLFITARLASTYVGTGERPSNVGGMGWFIDGGANVVVEITPLLASLRIDVTFKVLEQFGRRDFAP